MAFSFVRSATINSQTQVQFPTNTAGNIIVVSLIYNSSIAMSTLTDTAGNTYTLADSVGIEPWLYSSPNYASFAGGATFNWGLFYASNITAASNNVINIPSALLAGTNYSHIEAQEFSSPYTTFSLDSSFQDQIGNMANGNYFASPQTATISKANCLYILSPIQINNALTYQSFSVGTSFTTNSIAGNMNIWGQPALGSISATFPSIGAAPTGPFPILNGVGIYGSGGGGTVNPPVISPAGGTYTSPQTVTITDTTSGSTIYYTTDGSTPTTSSTVYTGPITVSTSLTIKAMAAASGYTSSGVSSSPYVIIAVPMNSLTGGGFIDSIGNPLAYGYLLVELSQDEIYNTLQICGARCIKIPLDSNGNVITSPPTSLFVNYTVSDGNFYSVSAYTTHGELVWGPNAQTVPSSPSPFNVSTWVPGKV